jgi:hypothetical protein
VTTLPVYRLEPGTVLLSDSFLPSHEGYVHKVREARELGDGCVRLFVEVLQNGVEVDHYDWVYWDGYEEVDVEP